jgi:hypothetical protein
MAKFNEVLVGRYNKALTKMFSMKGQAPAPQLASEITPAFNFFYGVENRILESWNRHGTVIVSAGGGATAVGARIRNPVAVNVIAVIEFLEIQVSLADLAIAVRLGATNADLSTTATPGSSRLDARGNPLTSLSLSRQVGPPGFGNQFFQTSLVTSTTKQVISNENQELTLAPGDALQVDTSATTPVLTISLIWRERFLEDSERSQ